MVLLVMVLLVEHQLERYHKWVVLLKMVQLINMTWVIIYHGISCQNYEIQKKVTFLWLITNLQKIPLISEVVSIKYLMVVLIVYKKSSHRR
jgi:hypothetical protein